MDDGYHSLPRGDKWGCLTAAIVGAPLFLFLFLLDALGDCAPDTSCRKGFISMVLLPSLVIAGAIYWSVRALIRARDSDDS